jgi:23S rRNA (guanosine2251-2'-O)-methyltransferase
MQKTKNEDLGRLSLDEFHQAGKIPIVIVLDNVRSLHNVGSVFRTADAFRIEAIYLCGITGKPPDREIRKTALGATESVTWKYFPTTKEALDELKSESYLLYAVEQAKESVLLSEFQPAEGKKIALIFGNEVNGVEQEVINCCDQVIEIPQLGTKHSLNISVSVGVVVWDVVRKMGLI